ncbi:solute carrier family 25 member 38 [Flagelloscypha sp. PMI_526]|nr:solute carrier family 25 member 38 [Flagelloscypha sp. PMI_526]
MKNVQQQLVSGAGSGFTSTIILQPFDLLKTRIQQVDSSVTNKPRNATVLLSTARSIITSSGAKGLWRGTTPSLLRNVPGIALYMTSLTQLRTFMAASPNLAVFQSPSKSRGSVLPALSPTGNLLSGATMRVMVGTILNPITVVKARFESGIYGYSDMTSAFRSLVQSGPRELFRGVLASSLRDAPYAGLFLLCYEGIKRKGATLTGERNLAAVQSLSAASAGAIATLSTQPFDVIKVHISSLLYLWPFL